jgi:excinuclease ABC subunit A
MPKATPQDSPETAIEIYGARTHNLRGIDCRVPHGRLTVVTGPSGAGKSSLAFDTVFAEGQRRFVESMSTYARQFLDQMERPPVDRVDHILPAVALEAKSSIKNARSTVGTITEVYDVLRLLYTHLGEVSCPHGHGPVRRFTAEEAAAELGAGVAGERFLLVTRVARPQVKAAQAKTALAELIRQGYARRLDEEGGTRDGGHGDGAVLRMEPGEAWPKKRDPLPLALGRFRADPGQAARLTATIEDAYRLGRGRVEARGERRRHFSRELGCPVCGETLRPPTPALFSFNSPLGACETCQGFGRVTGIDAERVVPNPRRTLLEHPIAPWNTPAYEDLYDELLAACRRRGIPLDVPWEELGGDVRRWIWSGEEPGSGGGSRSGSRKSPRRRRGKEDFVSLEAFFRWLERRTYRVHVRVLLARYRAYNPCPDCGGARLTPEARAVRLAGRSLPELTAMSIERLRQWIGERGWSRRQRETAGHLLDELIERVEVLHRVGLDYLTLDRQARTLSGGETQRIHLAAALGGGLTSTLYVLDEPTVGLHPRDSHKLLELLRDLSRRGNTVLVVEHDRTLIRGADHIIDLGPAAGEHGGRVVAEGPLSEVMDSETSLTARYLRDRPPTPAREHLARFRREHGKETLAETLSGVPRVSIRGASAHNLRGIDVDFPLAALVAVTGVSGSGKSTLVENVLYGTYQRSQGVADVETGEVEELSGLDGLEDVTLVDQRPLGRSSRSNPVTYIKAYDEIRKLFAATREAKRRGITAGHFSFNVDKGRCPACKGTGEIEVDMQFMAAVTVPCDTCQGHRFRPQVLAVTHRGKNIAEVLELTVEGAREHFAAEKRLVRRLRVLEDVGLGYLRLGQSTSTLSGGEAQRLKLASFLDRPAAEGRRLFLFDEPTTGLHLADIDLLYQTLRRLVRRGDGVVVVEHSPDLIARADWIVDLGPGGGVHGGELLFSGSLEELLERGESPTADELRRHLRWERLEETVAAAQGP